MTFAERLQSLLKERHISAYKLAKDIGIAQTQVSSWKKGNLPSFDNILALSVYFQVSTDYLMTGDEATPDNRLYINEKERNLIEQFRKLTPYEQDDVYYIVEMKVEKVKRGDTSQNWTENSGETA